jgi:hypothetical protein
MQHQRLQLSGWIGKEYLPERNIFAHNLVVFGRIRIADPAPEIADRASEVRWQDKSDVSFYRGNVGTPFDGNNLIRTPAENFGDAALDLSHGFPDVATTSPMDEEQCWLHKWLHEWPFLLAE